MVVVHSVTCSVETLPSNGDLADHKTVSAPKDLTPDFDSKDAYLIGEKLSKFQWLRHL